MTSRSAKFPIWNLPPMIISPEKRMSPKIRARTTPKKSPSPHFDFEENIMYSSAQPRTPLKQIELSDEEYAFLRREILKNQKPNKRKINFEVRKSPKKSVMRKSMDDEDSLEPTQII